MRLAAICSSFWAQKSTAEAVDAGGGRLELSDAACLAGGCLGGVKAS